MTEQLLNQFFEVGSLLVFPFWILMAFLPHWRWTQRIISSPWIIIGPALLYVIPVLPNAVEIMAVFNPPTMEGVGALMAEPLGTVAAWQHFLAFDLFMGRWIYLDSQANKISAWFVSPLLFFVLMLGPVGFVGYLIVRTVWLAVRDREWTGVLLSPVA